MGYLQQHKEYLAKQHEEYKRLSPREKQALCESDDEDEETILFQANLEFNKTGLPRVMGGWERIISALKIKGQLKEEGLFKKKRKMEIQLQQLLREIPQTAFVYRNDQLGQQLVTWADVREAVYSPSDIPATQLKQKRKLSPMEVYLDCRIQMRKPFSSKPILNLTRPDSRGSWEDGSVSFPLSR